MACVGRWAAAVLRPPAAAGAAACRVAAAASGRRGFARLKARNRGTVYVPRRVARKTLDRSRRHPDPTLLLPPYVSASELRILFRLDYASIFKLLGVRYAQSKYFWRDYDGREFETTSKRRVLVPFEIAAVPASGLGLRPEMADVEPDWDDASPLLRAPAPAVPVVAVLGHINHGKTTLLDALCGTAIAPTEPGGITQGVRAMTAQLAPPSAPPSRRSRRGREAAAGGPAELQRVTFLDTPGHEAFELHRGRTMAAADAAVVVVSAERGAEMQTEEVLLHAARWQVPIIFALNKVDLPTAHVDLTRAELRRQCQRLKERGEVDVDWTREAEEAVPISALHKRNLGGLVARLRDLIASLPKAPAKMAPPPTATPGAARNFRNVHRRTDFLVGIEAAPSAVALVLEVERGAETGETILTLVIRAGRLALGQYFVVGTVFGRISHLAVATGYDQHNWSATETASVGVAVKVMGLRSKQLGGDCAPDDVLFVLPRERAWRLSEHRRRIEMLSSLQTAGPPIEVPWEHDPLSLGTRTQAAFERSPGDQPEKHAGSAYQRRWEQRAVEEFSSPPPGGATAAGQPAGAPQAASVFSEASRRDFAAPLRGQGWHDGEAALDGGIGAGKPRLAAPAAPRSGREPEAAEEPGRRAEELEADGPRGRRSSARRRWRLELPGDTEGGAAADQERRFRVAAPTADGADDAADASPSGAGRRGVRAQRLPTGAWVTNRGPEKEFVYYTDRETFEEEAEIDTARLRARWRWRDRARWEEEMRQEQLKREEKALAETVRREVFGESAPSDEDEDKKRQAEQEDSDEEAEDAVQPLPPRNMPVVPMILKTRSVGQFDILMDEVERVQADYGVRVVIVHGGLGPVIPKDVVHAEVEKQYGLCPIYAFQVGVAPPAAGQAEAERIEIRRFDVFTDLVADVAARCESIREKARLARYRESLRQRPTASGL